MPSLPSADLHPLRAQTSWASLLLAQVRARSGPGGDRHPCATEARPPGLPAPGRPGRPPGLLGPRAPRPPDGGRARTIERSVPFFTPPPPAPRPDRTGDRRTRGSSDRGHGSRRLGCLSLLGRAVQRHHRGGRRPIPIRARPGAGALSDRSASPGGPPCRGKSSLARVGGAGDRSLSRTTRAFACFKPARRSGGLDQTPGSGSGRDCKAARCCPLPRRALPAGAAGSRGGSASLCSRSFAGAARPTRGAGLVRRGLV